MQLYILSHIDDQGRAVLEGDEARHLTKVMRAQVGHELRLMDGRGGSWMAKIHTIEGKVVRCDIIADEPTDEVGQRLALVVAPTKQFARMERMVQLAVEMGVTDIYFVKTKHTLRSDIPLDRVDRLIIASMKQCHRIHPMRCHDITSLAAWLDGPSASFELVYIGALEQEGGPLALQTAEGDVALLIGPEGDFSSDEMQACLEAGCQPVDLGPYRLRTETAAIFAAMTIWTNRIRHRALLVVSCLLMMSTLVQSQDGVQFALMKYRGGGDWYANPTALPNLARFCEEQLGMKVVEAPFTVDVGSPEIFDFAFIHMTGHGNVVFSEDEANNLRMYLFSGGFLHIDDNYGMDPYVRAALAYAFPELSLKALPPDHPIFHQRYDFPAGIPKIHEHDGQPAQAFGLFYEGRLICLYTHETDLGDGWEDENVHNNPPEVRERALQMGANIVQYVFGAVEGEN